MNKIHIIQEILILSLALLYKASTCQDAFISQTYLSGQYFNPAFTGSCGSASISTATRMEFIGMNDLYQTSLLTGDYYIKSINSGSCMYYLYDKNMETFAITPPILIP